MQGNEDVSRHYAHGELLAAIERGLRAAGKDPGTVSMDDLAPVDEFHIGGREASIAFLDQLGLTPSMHVLDVGSGVGGGARFVASRYGARVTGVDLTRDYVETATALNSRLGLDHRIELHCASALDLPFAAAGFDAAYMMHVGMNIADKHTLCREVARVLRPGACFGIYDVMRIGEADLVFPVPWAASAATSAVATPEEYRNALTAAGFEVIAERDRHAFALEFFAKLKQNLAASGGPPPLGLHILMGADSARKVQNMIENIGAGAIAPVELIGRKR